MTESDRDPNAERLENWVDAPDKMRKAIHLAVDLYVEGVDPPAHDFSQSTIAAVGDIIRAGIRAHPELRITIRKIAEHDQDD